MSPVYATHLPGSYDYKEIVSCMIIAGPTAVSRFPKVPTVPLTGFSYC